MAARANWKGFLKVGEVTAAVGLYTAASTSERIAFHTVNRATGNRVHREFVDGETGRVVERADQVKGYEVADGDHVVLEPAEIAAAVPAGDKTIAVTAFVACDAVDEIHLDKPYYLAPSEPGAVEAFVLIREGLRRRDVVAIAEAVLFRRVRTLMIRPYEAGLVATTLQFDYEVRPAGEAFGRVKARKVEPEMLELARHIIRTKSGRFDPAAVDDRYEAALADLVKAKIAGKPFRPRTPPKAVPATDLMTALRESAAMAKKAPRRKAATAAARRKAG